MGEQQGCARSGRDPVELLLRRIAQSSLLVAAAGCTDDTREVQWRLDGGLDARSSDAMRSDGAMDAQAQDLPQLAPGDYDPCAADAGTAWPVHAEALRLEQPVDYVGLRFEAAWRDNEGNWDLAVAKTFSEVGHACATATSSACSEQVTAPPAAFPRGDCSSAGCGEYSVVTTHGDDVQRLISPEQVSALLGTIDSFDEALLLAMANGYGLACNSMSGFPAADIHYVRRVPDGYELYATSRGDMCVVELSRHKLHVSSAGVVTSLARIDFPRSVCIGRIPAGLVASAPERQRSFAQYLASCAHLEAASVFAFERLADELRAHGAPTALIERALDAARDEVRHAQTISALARSHGAEPITPALDEVPTRSLEEIARENAVEGCVRETFGAVVGTYQAERAQDQALRFAMRSIAVDEARHASLSHAVHAWLMPQLDAAARLRIEHAQREMIATLHQESETREVQARAGLPSADVVRDMLAALKRTLWQHAAA